MAWLLLLHALCLSTVASASRAVARASLTASVDPPERARISIPVLGTVALPPVMFAIMDTELFQRLRGVKQLGLADMVYPGAVHSRFEHSVAVCYRSFERATRFARGNVPDEEKTAVLIGIAGLLHDIGHPPLAHAGERLLQGILKGWEHEAASAKIVKSILKEPNVRSKFALEGEKFRLEDSDVQFVQELINPPKKELRKAHDRKDIGKKWSSLIKSRDIRYSWCFEIVANWRGGPDVDREDYMVRDIHHAQLGGSNIYELDRLMKSDLRLMRYAYDETNPGVATLGFPRRAAKNLRRWFFEVRKDLHEKLYQHRVTTVLENGHLPEILSLAFPGIQVVNSTGDLVSISEALSLESFDAAAFARCTDSLVLERLENAEVHAKFLMLQGLREHGENLLRAGQLWREVRTRNFAKTCASIDSEREIATMKALKKDFENISSYQIFAHQGEKQRDPLEGIYFGDGFGDSESLPSQSLRFEHGSDYFGKRTAIVYYRPPPGRSDDEVKRMRNNIAAICVRERTR